MENLESLGDYIAAQKLELAAKNLQHLIKIQDEQVSLDHIVTELKHRLNDARNGDPDDFSVMLANQSNMLDATFLHLLEAAKKSTYTCDDKINLALKAQRQVERTIRTWQKITVEKKILRTN